jgi:uncharacterized protein (TIGR03000 family)
MYSMVLMAALTTSVDLPDRGHRGGGCCGCYGGGGGGCYGGGYGMGYGGGCCGMGYGGGYGMGYGGGCSGMGYGGMGYGGCSGMGMGMGYGGCMGMGMGYGGCMGMGMGGGMMMQGAGTIQQGGTGGTGGEKIKNKPAERGGRESMAPAPATIVVELPADAKLLIDDTTTTSTGANRVFQSPELNPGKTYRYTLTAEVVRNSKPVKIEQVVEVKAGETTPVRMTEPTVSAAQR